MLSPLDIFQGIQELNDLKPGRNDVSWDVVRTYLEDYLSEPIDNRELGEELDYLLYAGVIKGDDNSYKVAGKAYPNVFGVVPDSTLIYLDLGEEASRHVFSPKNPGTPLRNGNIRNLTRDQYDWELGVQFKATRAYALGRHARLSYDVSPEIAPGSLQIESGDILFANIQVQNGHPSVFGIELAKLLSQAKVANNIAPPELSFGEDKILCDGPGHLGATIVRCLGDSVGDLYLMPARAIDQDWLYRIKVHISQQAWKDTSITVLVNHDYKNVFSGDIKAFFEFCNAA